MVPLLQFFFVCASVVSYVVIGLCLFVCHLSFLGASEGLCFVIVAFPGYMYTGVRNYQALLLVHGQVNGQYPLVQPRFTCPKIVIFSYFSKKTYVVGTH